MKITKEDVKKTGNWLQFYIICSECQEIIYWGGNLMPNFCSSCGEKFEYDFERMIGG